jgi:hypothetical protein
MKNFSQVISVFNEVHTEHITNISTEYYYQCTPKVMPPIHSMETTIDNGCIIMPLDKASFQLSFHIVTTTGYAFLPVMEQKAACCTNKNLQGHPEHGLSLTSLSPLLKHTIHHLNVLIFTVLSHKRSASVNKCQRV